MLKTMFWPGLVTILSLSMLAIWFHHNSVEFELRQNAMVKLSDDHAWADVRLNGRDLYLYGVAPSVPAQQDASNKLMKLEGVRVVVDQSSLLPMAEPFVTSISLNAGEIKIEGHLPNQADRTHVIKLISQLVPGISILDETKTARGAPEVFISIVEMALKDVASYTIWAIEIADDQVKITKPANDS